jgi:hypothetical protein
MVECFAVHVDDETGDVLDIAVASGRAVEIGDWGPEFALRLIASCLADLQQAAQSLPGDGELLRLIGFDVTKFDGTD